MKKFTLGPIDSTSDYLMIGISGHLKDYRMSFFLNKQLNIHLIKKDDLQILWGPRSGQAAFSFYYYADPEMEVNYHLLTNRSPAGIIFPQIKNIDYLFFVNGLMDEVDEHVLLSGIREIQNVLTVSKVDMSKLKDGKSVVAEIELHTLKYQSS